MKVFCIGFNKTGTMSLNEYFNNAKLRSLHDCKWWYNMNKNYLDRYQCFTDGFEKYNPNKLTFPDLDFLTNTYPNAKFILQVRPLNKWLLSRLRHGDNERNYRNGKYSSYLTGMNINTFNDDVFTHWVNVRNKWHTHILDYFNKKYNNNYTDKLLILNIEEPDKVQILNNFLNLNNNYTDLPIINSNHNYINEEKEKQHKLQIKKFLDTYIVDTDHSNLIISKFKTL